MELFTPLTKFYEAIEDDPRINTSHISLYIALLQHWNSNGGVNPVQISRSSVMKMAKINGRSTYNKCMNNLQEFGYITYTPSTGVKSKSSIHLRGLKSQQ